MPQALLIVNPQAGRGKAQRVYRAFEDELRKRSLSFNTVTTGSRAETLETARAGAADYPFVITIGGDGTTQAVAEGLVDTEAAFAVVPVGSGNDFARSLRVPTDLGRIADDLRRATIKPIDTGRYRLRRHGMDEVEEGFFINIVGLGFDAAIAYESQQIKWLRNTPLYTWCLLKTLPAFKPQEMTIEADGRHVEGKFYLVTSGNGRFEGGGFNITPEALLNDGLLDVCMVHEMSRLRLLRLFPTVLWGGHRGFPEVRFERCSQIRIASKSHMTTHADGEILGVNISEINLEVRKGALKTLVHNS